MMYKPTQIYIENSVRDLPVTRRVLNKFADVPQVLVENHQEIKIPDDHTAAKRKLFINRLQGDLIKTCQGQGDVCCQYSTIDLITNCHLECSYCILQDYLKNNPIITIHANIGEILEAVREKALSQKNKILRVGAGELSDSLALDAVTEFSRDCVALANEVPNLIFEFKTKTTQIDNLLSLKHKGNVVAAWSVNPQKYIETEELKSACLSDRLKAARACADKGYPVAFHFDPLLYLPDWKEEYKAVITQIGALFRPSEIAWISVGSLRFTPGLKKITEKRFPKSVIMTGELFPVQDGKVRYFRLIREEMYEYIIPLLVNIIGKIPHYLCMETPTIWQKTFGFVPDLEGVESRICAHFESKENR